MSEHSQSQASSLWVEILVVVVLIGLLALLAIPQFQTTKKQAYQGKVQEVLEQLQTQQAAHLRSARRYLPADRLSSVVSDSQVRVRYLPPEQLQGFSGSNPSREGYVLLGWLKDANETKGQQATCILNHTLNPLTFEGRQVPASQIECFLKSGS